MLHIPLDTDGALLLKPRWAHWPTPWREAALLLVLLLPALLVVWLYRYELRLVARRAALGLLGLRLLGILVIWFVVAFQPSIVHERDDVQPSRVLVALDRSGSMELTDSHRTEEEKQRLAQALHWQDELPGKVDSLTRREITNHLLEGQPGILRHLRQHHEVGLLGFAASAWEMESLGSENAPQEPEKKSINLSQGETNLNSPLLKALESSAGQKTPLLGLILLSDGRHNHGTTPTALARRLGELGVPLYTVAIGPNRAAVDLAVLEVKAPASTQKGGAIPVNARIKISGLPPRDLVVELRGRGDKLLKEESLAHNGVDQERPIQFQIKLDEHGAHPLEVRLRPKEGALLEVTQANNALSTTTRVIKDKPRVLLVDGEARWEHYYLAALLQRDPGISMERIVFQQPRVGAIPQENLEKAGHAASKWPVVKDAGDDPLLQYDVIVLGDVPPDHFLLPERRRLERFVADRGGTLVLSAGKRHLPLDYLQAATDDPLLKMLPVSAPQPLKSLEGFALRLTGPGRLAPFLRIEDEEKDNSQRWEELPSHFWGVVGKPKPGATTLATPLLTTKEAAASKTSDQATAILVQQPYGAGRVLFIGLESTWRWRYRVGDRDHHRFWGQTLRWAAAADLLPAGNRHVRYGTRQPVYQQGEAVDLALRLGSDIPLPKEQLNLQMRVLRLGPGKKEEMVAQTAMNAVAGNPRLFANSLRDLPAGQYVLEVDSPLLNERLKSEGDLAQRRLDSTFTVQAPPPVELLDATPDWELLKSLAQENQGRFFTEDQAVQIVDLLEKKITRLQYRTEQRAWQDPPLVWWLLGVLLGLITLEWIGRKLAGLP